MTYTKPELVALTPAVQAIQNIQKGFPFEVFDTREWEPISAYDANE